MIDEVALAMERKFGNDNDTQLLMIRIINPHQVSMRV